MQQQKEIRNRDQTTEALTPVLSGISQTYETETLLFLFICLLAVSYKYAAAKQRQTDRQTDRQTA